MVNTCCWAAASVGLGSGGPDPASGLCPPTVQGALLASDSGGQEECPWVAVDVAEEKPRSSMSTGLTAWHQGAMPAGF